MRMFASLPGGGVVADPPTMKITLHKLYEDLWGEARRGLPSQDIKNISISR